MSSDCCVPLVTMTWLGSQATFLRSRICAAIASRNSGYPAGSPYATSSRGGLRSSRAANRDHVANGNESTAGIPD